MKKMWSIILTFFCITSCTNESKIADNAKKFFESYLSTDYKKAAEYCTPAFGEELLKSTEQFDNLQESIKSIIKERASKLTVEINDVQKIKDSDTLNVYYTIKGQDAPVSNILQFVKEDKEWKICRINKE